MYSFTHRRGIKGAALCECHKERKTRVPQLCADMKERKVFRTHGQTKSPGLCFMVVLLLFQRGNKKGKHKICNFRIAGMVEAVLLKTDEEIYKLNCNANI